MKNLFAILYNGLKNPRHYIGAIQLQKRYILLVGVLAALISGAFNTAQVMPVLNDMSQDLMSASEYIPQYRIMNNRLILSDDAKPLYYESDTFKLVVDDTIQSVDNQQIRVSDEQEKLLNQSAPLSLYLFENNAFLQWAGQVVSVPSYEYLFATPHRLSLFLSYIEDNKSVILITTWFMISSINFFSYWFQMLMIAAIANIWNSRLSQRISFGNRLKLVVIISFVPLILLELLTLLIPGFFWSFIVLGAITLFILHKAFKSHTLFIHSVVNSMGKDKFESLNPEEFEEALREFTEDLDKENQKKDNENNEK